jgi:hypothetical protein
MSVFNHRLASPHAVLGLCAVLLGGLALACRPAASPATPTPPAADPFAVVRATSQAAYQSGKALLDRGDLQGCVLIDTAKTNDPDNRPEIQQALEQCLTAIAQFSTTSAPTPAQRPIVVATVPVLTPVVPPAVPAQQVTPTPPSVAVGKPTAVSSANAKPQATQPTTAAQSASLAAWRDPHGRFSVSAPADWPPVDQPQSLFGTGVVQFLDPSGRAELDIAVDGASKAVSPELYAASMELAMQQSVPGYATEQMQPGSTAGNPSVRRVFTFTRRDAAGHDFQARAFQITVLKGATPYIITGSAPADQFQQYNLAFDQMVETFRFS